MNGNRETMTKQSLVHLGRKASLRRFAVPGLVFGVALAMSACTGKQGPSDPNCPTDTTSSGGGGTGGTTATAGSGGATTTSMTTTTTPTGMGGAGATGASGNTDNTFDHFNDPGDPFAILQQHAEEGPPEIRGRLHSCDKLPYTTLGNLLRSRGVNVDNPPAQNPKSGGQIYKEGGASLGVANYDARQAEANFHTTAGATKLFDIFVQSAPEVIANIQNMPDCQVGGVGKPMFDPMTGECVYESLSCLIGRPAKVDDMKLCNTMLQHADPANQADVDIKRRIVVASFLSAAYTCE